jgi:AraC-like DNA-binding protein
VFRFFTGFTIKKYFNRYRLHRAATELLAGDRRIIDIAFDVGFSSQEAFTRSFSKTYKITPAQFRLSKPHFEPFPPKNLKSLNNSGNTWRGSELVYE